LCGRSTSAHLARLYPDGSERIGLPVAANKAFATAGAMTAWRARDAGGFSLDRAMYTPMRGISFMRSGM